MRDQIYCIWFYNGADDAWFLGGAFSSYSEATKFEKSSDVRGIIKMHFVEFNEGFTIE